MKNRKAITIRLNQAEQFAMLNLLNFWGKDEKSVIKLALAQFIKITNEVQQRLQEAEDNEKASNSSDPTDDYAVGSDPDAALPAAPSAGSDTPAAAGGAAD